MTIRFGTARPDLGAHVHAVRGSFPDVVVALRDILGPKLCAYLGSAAETRTVEEWAAGVCEPSETVRRRLRLALQLAEAIAERDGADVARAWFQGRHPQLDERSPARMLRDDDIDVVGGELVTAARTFLYEG
jgi:hypothetical protein